MKSNSPPYLTLTGWLEELSLQAVLTLPCVLGCLLRGWQRRSPQGQVKKSRPGEIFFYLQMEMTAVVKVHIGYTKNHPKKRQR